MTTEQRRALADTIPTTEVIKDAVTYPRDRLGEPLDISGDRFDSWLARVRREAAREALDGLSAWLGDLAEKHPARSAHVPLMQGHITRYTTDNYPEEHP